MKLNEVSPKEWDKMLNIKLKADKQDSYQKNPTDSSGFYTSTGKAISDAWVDADVVNHPDHYNTGSIECIEAIEESMSGVAYKGYLKGNAMKYLWRYDYKGKRIEDLKKCQWYLNKLTVRVVLENED